MTLAAVIGEVGVVYRWILTDKSTKAAYNLSGKTVELYVDKEAARDCTVEDEAGGIVTYTSTEGDFSVAGIHSAVLLVKRADPVLAIYTDPFDFEVFALPRP